jgi:hypothetical protein
MTDPAFMTAEEDTKLNEKQAHAIIASTDVLGLFRQGIAPRIAGEERNAKLLYLGCTSRLMRKPMSIAIKGPSSAGKSNLRTEVLKFFPPEAVISFTTASEKALIYEEREFEHKILSMGEAVATEEQGFQDYLLRELISEGRIEHKACSLQGGGGVKTITVIKEGPVCFLVTTTKNKLHPENETRLLSLEMDDTHEQTRAVLRKLAQIEAGFDSDDDQSLEKWIAFQRWLEFGNTDVVVPFAPDLADGTLAASVRVRRDFTQVMQAVKAHALLHRKHRKLDERGRIVAEIKDYAAAHSLMHGIVSESSGTAIEPLLQQTLDAVRICVAGGDYNPGATAFEVGQRLKLDKSSALRRLRKAQDHDLVVNLETQRGQPGRYRPAEAIPEAVDILPDPSTLVQLAQPCDRTENYEVNQGTNGCKNGCAPDATADATDKLLINNEKTPSVAGLQGLQGVDEGSDVEERPAILESEVGLSRQDAEEHAALDRREDKS